jgi:hypothetical protein
VQSRCFQITPIAKFDGKDKSNQRMLQMEQILDLDRNLATPDQRREGDGFHDNRRSIHPAPRNLSRTAVTSTKGRSFVKCRQIEGRVFQSVHDGVRPQNSLEIDRTAIPESRRRRHQSNAGEKSGSVRES